MEGDAPPGTPAPMTPGRARHASSSEVWDLGSIGTEDRSPMRFINDRIVCGSDETVFQYSFDEPLRFERGLGSPKSEHELSRGRRRRTRPPPTRPRSFATVETDQQMGERKRISYSETLHLPNQSLVEVLTSPASAVEQALRAASYAVGSMPAMAVKVSNITAIASFAFDRVRHNMSADGQKDETGQTRRDDGVARKAQATDR